MTISEASEQCGLSADTIRYYERIGLIPHVPRKKNGIRDFDEISLKWLGFVKCMRNAGVQIEALIEYVTLMRNDDNPERRKQILIEQRAKLVDKMKHLQTTLDLLDYKIETYAKYKIK